MLPILSQWNRWGGAVLHSGYRRDILSKITSFLHTKEVVALIGLRRAGKTTVLYQIMDLLEAEGIPREAMLHMNFEEPSLAINLNVAMLDDLYNTFRETVYPSGKAYLFFDEIQNISGWEKWVRARNENQDIKIFITGSSASLMSRELATVLTGRHVEFYISTLHLNEILRFKNIELPSLKFMVDPPPLIQHTISQYMTWGGFPEVVLSQNDERKRILLRQYFDDILFKDIAMRHQIRDITMLRNIAVHLLTQTACLFSINRIAKIFDISLEMAGNYCHFIREAFLVDYLPYFSLKTAERNRNPQKIHVCDLGLRQIASLSLTPDYGQLSETLIYQYLQRYYRNDIFYWKGNQEVDFLIRSGNAITSIIQVAYDNLDTPDVFSREIAALDEAKMRYSDANSYLVVAKFPKKNKDARIISLWKVLLEDENLF